MPRNVTVPAASAATAPSTQVVEEKRTVTTQIPDVVRPAATGPKPTKPHINVWFAKMPPDERANDYAYTIYRDDTRIIIVDENLDDRASGSMLYKFTPDEIRNFPEGPFLQELSDWVKARYGGGEYHVYVNHRKSSTLEYNKGFRVDGEPILSPREGWRPGMQPMGAMPGASGGDSASLVPMLMKLIDDKLAGISQQRTDPNAALADVTKVIMDANSSAFRWAIENAPKPTDPTHQLEQMRSLLLIFKDLQPPVAAGNAPQDPFAQFTQFMTVMKSVRELDAPREQPADFKTTMIEAVKTAVREVGGRGNRPGTDWGALVEKALPLLAPLGMALMAKLQARPAAPPQTIAPAPQMQHNAPRFPSATAPAPGNGFTGGPAGAGRIPGSGAMPAAPPYVPPSPPAAAAAESQPTDQITITEEVQDAVLWNHATKRLVDMLQHDETGDVAAEFIDKMLPNIGANMAMMNEQTLMGMIVGDPELSKVKDDPRLPRFLKEFCDYFRGDEALPETPKPN